jgi:hypothetical protein
MLLCDACKIPRSKDDSVHAWNVSMTKDGERFGTGWSPDLCEACRAALEAWISRFVDYDQMKP